MGRNLLGDRGKKLVSPAVIEHDCDLNKVTPCRTYSHNYNHYITISIDLICKQLALHHQHALRGFFGGELLELELVNTGRGGRFLRGRYASSLEGLER